MILRSYACESDECECPRAMSSAAQAFGVRTWSTFRSERTALLFFASDNGDSGEERRHGGCGVLRLRFGGGTDALEGVTADSVRHGL
jgi:hypothetical protein